MCSVVELQKYKDLDTGETKQKPVTVIENQPCRLSKKTITATGQTETANVIQYAPLLFISPNVEIKPGSEIVITQNGVSRKYKRSGEPFVYETHQEIVLQRTDKA